MCDLSCSDIILDFARCLKLIMCFELGCRHYFSERRRDYRPTTISETLKNCLFHDNFMKKIYYKLPGTLDSLNTNLWKNNSLKINFLRPDEVV